MPRLSRPRQLGPHQVAALQRMLPTPELQAAPLVDGRARVVDIMRGLRRKGLVEKHGPWIRLTEAGLERLRVLQAEEVEHGS